MPGVFIFVQYVSWKSMIAPMTAYNSCRGGSKGGLETPLQKYIKEAKRTMYWYKNTLKCIISWNKCHFNTLCNKTTYTFQGVAPTTPPTPYLVK